jgi:hypothetical protein
LQQTLQQTENDNNELTQRLLALFSNVTRASDRIKLFGIQPSEGSNIDQQLLAAIEVFVILGGAGRRPWEDVFKYLRFASVMMNPPANTTQIQGSSAPATQIPGTSRTQTNRRQLSTDACRTYAVQAENDGLFGRMEMPPSYCGAQSGSEAQGWEGLCG